MAKYVESAIGVLVHPWVNTPDVKYSVDGVYQTRHRLTGPAALAQKARIDEATEAAFVAYCEEKGFDASTRKKWSTYVPYEVEESADGVPTGGIVFHYKQNAKIKRKATGKVEDVKIALYDATGKEMHSQVWSGSEGRVRYSMRAVPMVSLKKVGVRLDFAAVQISKLVTSGAGGGGGGFGAIEGGYEEEEREDAPFAATDASPAAGADY